jgi:hypothetical protein
MSSDSCSCECSHYPDLGACRKYISGANGRCVYCDHANYCHPGKGEFANGPLAPICMPVSEKEDAKPIRIKKHDTRKRHKSKRNGG